MMMSRDGPGPDKDWRKTDYIFLIFHTILEICVDTLKRAQKFYEHRYLNNIQIHGGKRGR